MEFRVQGQLGVIVYSKLGIILENKVFQKLKLSKVAIIKKPSTKLIFLNEKKSERFGWLRIRILLHKGFQSSVGRK